MRTARFALVACIAALSLTVVACGSDDEGSSATAAPEAETTATNDIVAVAQGEPQLSTLVDAVTAADLAETLQGEGPYTVFAPTNEAFRALGDTLDELLEPANKDELADVLTYHVIADDVKAADLTDGQSVETVQGESLRVQIDGDEVKINDATVIQADVPAANGTVHVIDGVLTP